MEVLLICDPGASEACVIEAKRAKVEIVETQASSVLVKGSAQQITDVVMHGQTLLEAILVLEKNMGEKLDAKQWPVEGKTVIEKLETFAVHSRNKHPQQENKNVGELVQAVIKKKVDLENPQLLFIVQEKTLGISLLGIDGRKRNYRVFTSSKSLRSTVAASTLLLTGYTGKEKLILPYENDGTLAIEAAMMSSRKSPHAYTSLSIEHFFTKKKSDKEAKILGNIDVVVPTVPFLKAVQKNAKIAGVHKQFTITKAEFDWLDTKFEEASKDFVIAALPTSGKHRERKDAEQIADELGYQCNFMLNKKGKIGILCFKPDELIPLFIKHKFVARKQHEIYMGEQVVHLIVFERA